MQEREGFTRLIAGCNGGDETALNEVMPLVYDELRRLARSYLSKERTGHTLQPTALVHEAYIRLLGQQTVDWSNHAQFFGIAAQMMRRILVNHAEARLALKRSLAPGEQMPNDATSPFSDAQVVDALTLSTALNELRLVDPRQEQIIELRFFGGLSLEETAEAMNISLATVKREWSVARLWIRKQLADGVTNFSAVV